MQSAQAQRLRHGRPGRTSVPEPSGSPGTRTILGDSWAWQGRLGLTMATSFFSSSSSFSVCFFLPPPFSAVVAAGEYSRPACRRKRGPGESGRLELLFPLKDWEPRHWEWRPVDSKSVVIPGEERGCRVAGTPGSLFAKCWQSPGALCLNFRKG